MPVDVQVGKWTQTLVDLFNLKGRYRPRLDDIIVPVVLLEPDEPSRIGTSEYWETANETAVVGLNGIVQFSGQGDYDCLPLEVQVTCTTAGLVVVKNQFNPPVAPVFTGTTTTKGRDIGNMQLAGPVPVTTGTFAVGGLGGGNVRIVPVAAGVPTTISLKGWRIPAGSFLWVYNNTANDPFRWSARWSADLR